MKRFKQVRESLSPSADPLLIAKIVAREESRVTSESIAALVAAGVALLVGLGGVAASFFQATRAARATLQAQLNGAKTDALVTVLRHVELRGMAIQDRIFNLTMAEQEGDDWEDYQPGPQNREINDLPRTDFAESAALVAAYGDASVRIAFEGWSDAVEAWNDKYEDLRFKWFEGDRNRTRPEELALQKDGELSARRKLGRAVNETLRDLSRI